MMLPILLLLFLSCSPQEARLLSVGRHDKIITVSLRPSKEKVLLDGSTAKITIFGRPGEWKELPEFSLIHINWRREPLRKFNQDFDGTVTEICIEKSLTLTMNK